MLSIGRQGDVLLVTYQKQVIEAKLT